MQTIAVVSTVLVIFGVVAIPAFGYYKEVIAREQEAIAVVNGTEFKMTEYINQLRYRQRQIDSQAQLMQQFGGQSAAQQVAQQRSVIPTQIVFDWVDDELVRQLTPKMGISVTPEEVDQQLRKDLEPPKDDDKGTGADAQPTATPTDPAATPTPTAVPVPFEERYKNLLAFTGLSDDAYREMVRTRLLRGKLEEQLKNQVPTSADMIQVRGIMTDTEKGAQMALDRLNAGESWDTVAKDISIDTTSAKQGGDLGWIARGLKGNDFDTAAFGLKDNNIAGPFKVSGYYWILQRTDGPANRQLTDEQRTQLQDDALSKWLEAARKDPNNKVEYRITSDRQLWAQDRIDKEQAALNRRNGQQAQQGG